MVEEIESDALQEPKTIVGLYTYDKNILTLQTPTIRVFKVNGKMTKLKAIEKTEAYGKKVREIYKKTRWLKLENGNVKSLLLKL